jgi:hypothetical protein
MSPKLGYSRCSKPNLAMVRTWEVPVSQLAEANHATRHPHFDVLGGEVTAPMLHPGQPDRPY